jgi:hypothetical protein
MMQSTFCMVDRNVGPGISCVARWGGMTSEWCTDNAVTLSDVIWLTGQVCYHVASRDQRISNQSQKCAIGLTCIISVNVKMTDCNRRAMIRVWKVQSDKDRTKIRVRKESERSWKGAIGLNRIISVNAKMTDCDRRAIRILSTGTGKPTGFPKQEMRVRVQ